MKFSTKQLPSGKWGIYSDSGLLATVDCQATCETIMANLSSGRRDAPVNDTNELYQVPQLRKRGLKQAHSLKAALPGESPVDSPVEPLPTEKLAPQILTVEKVSQGYSKPLEISAEGPKAKGARVKGTKAKRVSAKRSHKLDQRAKASAVS